MNKVNPKVLELIKQKSGIMLDIGGGGNPQPGFVNMDIREMPGVDIVQDCEQFPWPLPDECVSKAIAIHLVEHINPAKFGFVNFMNEVWRIMQVDGQFAISCPYATSHGMYQDPTHINFINETTWAYFDPLEPNTNGMLYKIYKPKPWKIEYNAWSNNGNMEVLLRKRREDRSYNV